jgi:hypothetical protein
MELMLIIQMFPIAMTTWLCSKEILNCAKPKKQNVISAIKKNGHITGNYRMMDFAKNVLKS